MFRQKTLCMLNTVILSSMRAVPFFHRPSRSLKQLLLGAAALMSGCVALAQCPPSTGCGGSKDGVVNSVTLESVKTHIDWALRDTGPCSHGVVCHTYMALVTEKGVPAPVPIYRGSSSAQQWIIWAKAARIIGWNNYAMEAVLATQIHNKDEPMGTYCFLKNNPEDVLHALDQLSVPPISDVPTARGIVRMLLPPFLQWVI